MLRPGWVLERYFGWQVVESSDGMKILRRRRGPFVQALAMLHDESPETFVSALGRHGLCSPATALVVIDFLGRLALSAYLAGSGFEPVHEQRWFGAGTFVVDLDRDETELWNAMEGRSRTACRQAERNGMHVTCDAMPDASALEHLVRLHAVLVYERGLPPLPQTVLPKMAADGGLFLARGMRPDGATVTAHLVYVGSDTGFFLYGAGEPSSRSGIGNLVQWEIIRRLKSRGLRWYDLGQVPCRDPAEGIYRFKSSFGGDYVDYGSEYTRMAPFLRRIGAAVQWARARWRHV